MNLSKSTLFLNLFCGQMKCVEVYTSKLKTAILEGQKFYWYFTSLLDFEFLFLKMIDLVKIFTMNLQGEYFMTLTRFVNF